MSTVLKSLYDLQKIDSDLHLLRDLKNKRPLELEKDRRKLTLTKGVVDAIGEETKQTKMAADKAELEVKQAENEIDRLQIQLNTAKTNQEYTILKDQIDGHRAKNDELEEAILEKLSRIDGLNDELTQAKTQVDEVEKELALKEDEMNAFLREVDGKIEGLGGERGTHAATIPADAMELYDKVLNRYTDSAVAPVEKRVCQGCYMSVTTQAITQLMTGAELVQCKRCLRILYLPEGVS